MEEKCKCQFPNDLISIKPDGEHELDPCIYQDIRIYTNCTVIVSKCINCGHETFSWIRNEDSEDFDPRDYNEQEGEW